MDLSNCKKLVDLHQALTEFAEYYKNKGGQQAHRLIKNELIDKVKSQPRDGSKEGMLINEGYDKAVKQVLDLLHKVFVP